MDSLTIQILGVCISIIIPLLFVAFVVNDRNSRLIMLFFCWGVFAGFIAFIGNNYFGGSFEQQARITTSIAPIVEEFAKALPMLLFLLIKKQTSDNEIIVYSALASGAGFSVQETIYYFSMTSGQMGDLLTLVVRTLTTALMHAMATGIFGLGLMMFIKQRYILLPLSFGLLCISTFLHALYNLLLPTGAVVFAVLIPIGLYLTGLVFLESIRQKRV